MQLPPPPPPSCSHASDCTQAHQACGCERLRVRCGQCNTTLYSRLRAGLGDEPQHSCTADTDCNAAGGSNTCQQQRCRCHVDPATGYSWGGWNCSTRNAPPSGVENPMYTEQQFRRYYKHLDRLGGETLEHFQLANRSDSGEGSTAGNTVGVRDALPVLLALLGVETIVDVPCGDFNYMKDVVMSNATPSGIRYVGLDLVAPLIKRLQMSFGSAPRAGQGAQQADSRAPHISFMTFDLSIGLLWPADLVIIRDLLFHFDERRVLDILDRVDASGSRYLLATTYAHNTNARFSAKFVPGRGFKSFAPWNLQGPPFHLGEPLLSIGNDGNPHRVVRVMALWRLPLARER